MSYSSGIVGELGEKRFIRCPFHSPNEMSLPDTLQPDWSAIEADYLQNKITIKEICKRHDIAQSSLMQVRKRMGWPARNQTKPPTRKVLISRMYMVLEKQIRRMEMTAMQDVDDKEIALLGQLARTLEKLVELDTKHNPSAGNKLDTENKNTKEMKLLRQKLTRRIDQLEHE